jgi:hypothetical protein
LPDRLAAGVAHNVKGSLAAVPGGARLIEDGTSGPECIRLLARMRDEAAVMQHVAKRATACRGARRSPAAWGQGRRSRRAHVVRLWSGVRAPMSVTKAGTGGGPVSTTKPRGRGILFSCGYQPSCPRSSLVPDGRSRPA